MKAIILAAGRGSRMKNLTDDRPKCLTEVQGRPLLDWQLDALSAAGVSEIAIVTGYKRELLSDRGLVEFHNPRWAETNMVSSLACAESWLQAGPCIVSYSDIFYTRVAVQALMNCPASLAVTYDPNWLEMWKARFGDPLLDAETFRLTPLQTLAEIGKKPYRIDEIQGQYMGLLRITPPGWSEIERILAQLSLQNQDKAQMTAILQLVLEENHIPITALPYVGPWGEIDSEEDLNIYKTAGSSFSFGS